MVVLDTHAVVWWAADPSYLSARALRAIEGADRLAVPSIVFWEVSLLVRKRRLGLEMPVGEWATRVQTIPRVDVLPLTAEVALLADTLRMHADPVDRFIVASALECASPLVTKDRLVRGLRFVKTIW